MRKVLDCDVIKAILSENNLTQAELSELMGYKQQSAMSQLMNRKRISLEKTVEVLNKAGYSLMAVRNGAISFEIVASDSGETEAKH